MRFATIVNIFAAVTALVASQAYAAPVNLVRNGSFETINDNVTLGGGAWDIYGSIDGWSTIGHGVEVRNNVAGSAYDGLNFVELDTTANSTIAQTVATTAGKYYTLSFAIADRDGVPLSSQGVEVFWNDVSQGVYSNASDWSVKSFKLLATGSASSLKFSAAGDSDSLGTSLDKVSLISAVPEPETYGMLLAGLGLVGFVARRKAAK